ncbi:erythromycin esterase family protein [Streptomyces spectabilis]|uniref:Erythromycin esterase family protein n=1 Tax=Streptomyces spectabilis TaxID=68270 RepID=A0A516R4R5_STRST|nr:erythromycin esterase family protein [Streptomyces spectabilis]QDQ10648.1 erythromycin esterase family protein [Streptomyces spectabilis]
MARTARRTAPLVLVVAAVGAGALVSPQSAGAAAREDDPVRALERVAHPLRSTGPGGSTKDLRPLDAMVGGATVVGLGEATHGSHEFFTMKDRVFRHLVEDKGFTTFAQEVSWTTGLRFDAYVRGGEGDVRALVHRELAKTPWDTEEYVELLTWMRAYNDKHPQRRLRFMGNDLNYPRTGEELYDGVTDYVRRHEPDLLPRITELYAPLRRLTDGDAHMGRPQAERERLAERARTAYRLLKARQPEHGSKRFALALHHARSVRQTATIYAFELNTPDGDRAAMLYRDRIMAENTAWWQRYTGTKVLLSAHNAHVAYASYDPRYPKMQGAFLRDRLGKKYVSMGFTFDRGAFMAQPGGDGAWKSFSVGPATPGMNEHTLDKVRHDDYYVDLRKAPAAARSWLRTARTTYSIGAGWPDGPYRIALASSHDVLIHLHDVTAAHRQTP